MTRVEISRTKKIATKKVLERIQQELHQKVFKISQLFRLSNRWNNCIYAFMGGCNKSKLRPPRTSQKE